MEGSQLLTADADIVQPDSVKAIAVIRSHSEANLHGLSGILVERDCITPPGVGGTVPVSEALPVIPTIRRDLKEEVIVLIFQIYARVQGKDGRQSFEIE